MIEKWPRSRLEQERAATDHAAREAADAASDAEAKEQIAVVNRDRALGQAQAAQIHFSECERAATAASTALHEVLKNGKGEAAAESKLRKLRDERDSARERVEIFDDLARKSQLDLAEASRIAGSARQKLAIATFRHRRVLAYLAGCDAYEASREARRPYDAAAQEYEVARRELLALGVGYMDATRLPDPSEFLYAGAAPEEHEVAKREVVVVARIYDRERCAFYEVGDRVTLPIEEIEESPQV